MSAYRSNGPNALAAKVRASLVPAGPYDDLAAVYRSEVNRVPAKVTAKRPTAVTGEGGYVFVRVQRGIDAKEQEGEEE